MTNTRTPSASGVQRAQPRQRPVRTTAMPARISPTPEAMAEFVAGVAFERDCGGDGEVFDAVVGDLVADGAPGEDLEWVEVDANGVRVVGEIDQLPDLIPAQDREEGRGVLARVALAGSGAGLDDSLDVREASLRVRHLFRREGGRWRDCSSAHRFPPPRQEPGLAAFGPWRSPAPATGVAAASGCGTLLHADPMLGPDGGVMVQRRNGSIDPRRLQGDSHDRAPERRVDTPGL